MKIKNIKEYRKFYKEEVRDQPTRDENFIGNFRMENGKRKFGWFDIYHGDKEGYGKAENGIENFLQSFLDMARDGQAVYEFLQNAVDAGSSHYTMVWGKDELDGNYYLMVANNGDMFSLNSVRSILNVGSSTKSVDSSTIGKFGIGFKLAHRLVGKDNGLDELLHENSGPLLFSWQNYDIIQLANGSPPEPSPMDIVSIGDNQYCSNDISPWLFKILITCFPNLPENESVIDLPTMANGIISPKHPFSQAEYETFGRWVKKYIHIFNRETYETGALFFIKLGEGKENELAEGNLHEGVKFALAILNETAEEADKSKNLLRTVQLNNSDPITLPDLQYLKINISKVKEADTYAYIRFGAEKFSELSNEHKNKLAQESDIEVLVGFRPYDKIDRYFNGAPNFYLYFPLSEEVHNFNYILHSNAFYKGSSRTFLHKGSGKEDGINERLLKVIVERIEGEFVRLTSSSNAADRRIFLDFYAALLSSGQSTNNERKWIEEPYVDRITNLLKRYIPCRMDQYSDDFIISSDFSSVFIKDTNVDVDIVGWGLNELSWFYWGKGDDLEMKYQAIKKLNIKKYTIQNLLSLPRTITTHLNEWIGSDQEKMAIIMQELPPEQSLLTSLQRENLFLINLFLFQNDETYSIESFKVVDLQGYFICRNKLVEIRDILAKLNLKHSINDVEEFTKSYLPYFGGTSQLGNYEVLTNRFSEIVKDEFLDTLSDDERVRIFNAFRTFNDSPGQRMAKLKIFANKNGDYQMLQHLLADSSQMWLSTFKINKDFGALIRTYLVKEENHIYQAIIYKFWPAIAMIICKDITVADKIFSDIITFYGLSDWNDKNKQLIGQDMGVFFEGNFIDNQKTYFDDRLFDISAKNYTHIQEVLFRLFDVVLPDQFFLPHLRTSPFNFTSSELEFDIQEGVINSEDLGAILLLNKLIDGDLFDNHAVGTHNGRFIISRKKVQIYTHNKKLLKYVDTYLTDQFILIPEELARFKDRVNLTHGPLLNTIIHLFEENDIEQEIHLIEAVLDEGLTIQLDIFNKLTYINLDALWQKGHQNEIYLRLARNLLLVGDDDFDISNIHAKLNISREHVNIPIIDIHTAEDTILIPFNGKELEISQSQLLDLEDKEGISIIEEFSHETVRRGLLVSAVAERLFKQHRIGVSEELVSLFNDKITNGQLTNAHQLIFLLFSGKFEKTDFGNYSIKMSDNEFYDVGGNLLMHSADNSIFIDNIFHLHNDYYEMQTILGISDIDVLQYGADAADILTAKFLFVSGADVDVLSEKNEVTVMLDYLFASWSHLNSQVKTSRFSETWKKILGFDPELKLIGQLVLEEEVLPPEVLLWLNDELPKIEFLKAIGVSTEEKGILRLRHWLCTADLDDHFSKEASNYPSVLLFNTIKGLSSDFNGQTDKQATFKIDSARLKFIEDIYTIYGSQEGYGFIPDLVYCSQDVFKIVYEVDKDAVTIDPGLLNLLFDDPENNLDALFEQEFVVKQSMADIFHFDNLNLEEEFLIPQKTTEHDEPFYLNWKVKYQTRLYKVDEIKFNIFYDEKSIGTIERGELYLDESGKECLDIYYLRTLSLENLLEKITDAELAAALGEMISDKDSMLRNLYNVMNAAGKDDISDNNLRALRVAMMQENIVHQRASYAENMLAVTKYSSKWFTNFLNYLATFESQQRNIQQKTIVFQKISNYLFDGNISDKFFTLNAANSLIPVNIEEFAEFVLEVVFIDKSREKIMVEGVSKKGQDLLIYCRKAFSLDTLLRLPEILSLKISFTPRLDLLKELYNAFVNVNNIDEWEDIFEAIPALNYIYGPPGTGKTTTICKRIAGAVKENHNLRVLLLTPTNKAADVVAKKLIKDHSLVSVIRVGKPTDAELDQEGVYQDSLTDTDINSTNVIASTVHRIPYFKVNSDNFGIDLKLFELSEHWDFVIFDESSMISLPYMVFCIQAIKRRSPKAKIIIAGDPQQIPPVSALSDADMEELDIEEEHIYKMMGVNSFVDSRNQVRELDIMEQLQIQYRSLPQIGQLFSELAYGSELTHARGESGEKARPLPERFKEIFNQVVSFVNIPLEEDNSILSIGKLFYSAYHLHSAIFIAELVKYFDSCLEIGDLWTIGLIAPYKAQAALMNRIITSYNLSDRIIVSCDTVHGFQGDECDMVFFVANPNQMWYTGHPKSLLSKKYIYNVAISRAKDYLMVLHPFKKINGNTFINGISNSYQTNFGFNPVLDYRKIEKLIFGEDNFIERNSYLTGHDSINVFGKNDVKYFIKSNDQAIDIVLKT